MCNHDCDQGRNCRCTPVSRTWLTKVTATAVAFALLTMYLALSHPGVEIW